MVPRSRTDQAQSQEEDGTQGAAGETGTAGLTQTLEVTLMEAGTLEDTSTLAIMLGGQRPGQEVTMGEVMAVADTSMMGITAVVDTSREMEPTFQDLSSSL